MANIHTHYFHTEKSYFPLQNVNWSISQSFILTYPTLPVCIIFLNSKAIYGQVVKHTGDLKNTVRDYDKGA